MTYRTDTSCHKELKRVVKWVPVMADLKSNKSNALKIHPADNVAIAIRDIKKGEGIVVDGTQICMATEDIPASHKVALVPISKGTQVIRYGEPIVVAISDIGTGQWVHVHNTRPVER